jgi:hypothetical protein
MAAVDYAELDLRERAADRRLDNDEKFELRELGSRLDPDRVRYLRNRAFDMARELILAQPPQALDALRWLEQVVKTLDVVGTAPAIDSSPLHPRRQLPAQTARALFRRPDRGDVGQVRRDRRVGLLSRRPTCSGIGAA